MKLDYSSLAQAVTQLQKSLDYLHSDLREKTPDCANSFGLPPSRRSNTARAGR